MKKSEITKIRIDIKSNEISVLSLMFAIDGTIVRQGNGSLPADDTSLSGISDDNVFEKLIILLDENIFAHTGVYDHPDKPGMPITYSIAFLAKDDEVSFFEFRLGSETSDVGELLPYLDNFISQAIALTDDWYTAELAKTLKQH